MKVLHSILRNNPSTVTILFLTLTAAISFTETCMNLGKHLANLTGNLGDNSHIGTAMYIHWPIALAVMLLTLALDAGTRSDRCDQKIKWSWKPGVATTLWIVIYFIPIAITGAWRLQAFSILTCLVGYGIVSFLRRCKTPLCKGITTQA